MELCRGVLVLWLGFGGALVVGCSSTGQELPTKEKIQQQLKRDAAMRAEEDRLDRKASGSGPKR